MPKKTQLLKCGNSPWYLSSQKGLDYTKEYHLCLDHLLWCTVQLFFIGCFVQYLPIYIYSCQICAELNCESIFVSWLPQGSGWAADFEGAALFEVRTQCYLHFSHVISLMAQDKEVSS